MTARRLIISIAPLHIRFDQFFELNGLYCEEPEVRTAVITNVLNSVLTPKAEWADDATGSMMIDYLVNAVSMYRDLAAQLWRFLMDEAMRLLCSYLPNIMDPGYVPVKHVFTNDYTVEIEFA